MIYDGNLLKGNEKFHLGDIINFEHSAISRGIYLEPGIYKMECWGAQGTNSGIRGGYGGYVKGLIDLPINTAFYVFVGGQGNSFNANINTTGSGLWGGGASDIRLISGSWYDITSLRSRIIVAAGGGAGGNSNNTTTANDDVNNNLTAGGGLVGLRTSRPCDGNPGTQTTGGAQTITQPSWGKGNPGSFGIGGYADWANTGNGGGGYYGASGGTPTANNQDGVGAGGSSFISGYDGCNAIKSETDGTHTGQSVHYSGLIFTETEMIAGNALMPSPISDIPTIGRQGNGFVRITFIQPSNATLYFVKLNNKLYYFKEDWIALDKTIDEITINDIIDYSLGNDPKYKAYEYLTELQKFNEGGKIEFIVGSHFIEQLKTLEIRPHDEKIKLGTIYNFNIVK